MIGKRSFALVAGVIASTVLAAAAEPVRYTVRYGLTLGGFDPIAGEILCVADTDCAVPLILSPEIEIRLRGDPRNPAWGTAYVFCRELGCGFGNGRRSTQYGEPVNRLRIYAGVAPGGGRGITLGLRRPPLLGQFDFAIVE